MQTSCRQARCRRPHQALEKDGKKQRVTQKRAGSETQRRRGCMAAWHTSSKGLANRRKTSRRTEPAGGGGGRRIRESEPLAQCSSTSWRRPRGLILASVEGAERTGPHPVSGWNAQENKATTNSVQRTVFLGIRLRTASAAAVVSSGQANRRT